MCNRPTEVSLFTLANSVVARRQLLNMFDIDSRPTSTIIKPWQTVMDRRPTITECARIRQFRATICRFEKIYTLMLTVKPIFH